MQEQFRFIEEPRVCSYLPAEVASLELRAIAAMSPAECGDLLARGYRRFGWQVFRPACRNCSKCLSVRIPVQQFNPSMRRTFAHEAVHACLANIGRFPAWLHEGLAQKLSGDTLSATALGELQDKIRAGALPKLEKMGQDWSHLSGEHARLAYNLSLAAVDVLVANYANYGLRNVLRSPELLQQVTVGIDKTLGL